MHTLEQITESIINGRRQKFEQSRMAIIFGAERITRSIDRKRKKSKVITMDRRKNKRTGRKKRLVKNSIYVTPDGGETIYEQLPNGDRKLINQSQLALDREQEMYEREMIGVEAIALRRKYPALQKAWDQYKTVWKLVAYND